MKLGDLVGRVAAYFDPLAIFKVPFHLAVNQALFNVGLDVRVYGKGNVLFVLLGEDVVEIGFNIINKQHCRAYGTGAVACGANLGGNNVHFGANTLAGDLHQTKFTWGQNGVLGTVERHFVAQVVEQIFTVGRFVHIDKIDNHDTTHIA